MPFENLSFQYQKLDWNVVIFTCLFHQFWLTNRKIIWILSTSQKTKKLFCEDNPKRHLRESGAHDRRWRLLNPWCGEYLQYILAVAFFVTSLIYFLKLFIVFKWCFLCFKTWTRMRMKGRIEAHCWFCFEMKWHF